MKERHGTPLPDDQLETRLLRVENELDALLQTVGSIATFRALSEVDIYTFEGGAEPVRQTEGAIGYDAFSRAIVDPLTKPTAKMPLRQTLADFNKTPGWETRINPSIRDWVIEDTPDNTKYEVALPPGERLMIGLGFATKMEFPMFYWVAPRSGYAARGITVANSPGTVDPDYRGEAGALIENNSGEDFIIGHNMRVVQVIFSLALIPHINTVGSHAELGDTARGAGGFGSTGTHGNFLDQNGNPENT